MIRSCKVSLFIVVLACLHVLPAPASEVRSDKGDEPLAALRLYLEKETAGLPGRAEIVLGSLDPRLKLAPCASVQPFLAPGTRLWGKAMIGLRCLESPGWTAWLPVEIRIRGTVLVAAGALGAGQQLTERDVRPEEVDLTREPGAVTAFGQLADRVLSRPLAPGQVLRQDQFRIKPLVNPGDPVKVVFSGAGFAVSTEAHALAQAVAGQSVRVQTTAGKILTGMIKPGRVVEVSY